MYNKWTVYKTSDNSHTHLSDQLVITEHDNTNVVGLQVEGHTCNRKMVMTISSKLYILKTKKNVEPF